MLGTIIEFSHVQEQQEQQQFLTVNDRGMPADEQWAGLWRARLPQRPGQLVSEVDEGRSLVWLHLPAHAHEVVHHVRAGVRWVHQITILNALQYFTGGLRHREKHSKM